MSAGPRRPRDAAALAKSVCAPFAFLAIGLGLVGACGTTDGARAPQIDVTGDASSGSGIPNVLCSPGTQGCACSDDGAKAACGRVDSRVGNYVTCSEGYSTCTSGTWGPCIGNRLVTQTVPSVVMTTSGIHTLSSPITC